jgi:hypothetical protein
VGQETKLQRAAAGSDEDLTSSIVPSLVYSSVVDPDPHTDQDQAFQVNPDGYGARMMTKNCRRKKNTAEPNLPFIYQKLQFTYP